MPGDFLALVDTLRIHDYVFGSTELKQIRGASQLLNDCTNDKWRAKIASWKGEEIVCRGGNAIARFQTEEQAWGFCREAKVLLERRTGTARAAVHVEERRRQEEFPGSGTGSWMQRAMDGLNRAKQRDLPLGWGDQSPFARFCDVCGVRNAERPLPGAPAAQWVCRSCFSKGSRGGGGAPRSYWFRAFAESEAAQGGLWANTVTAPRDLNQLGSFGRPDGYLGFVYLDINRLSALLDGVSHQSEYAALSKAVQKSVEGAVYHALAEVLLPREDKGAWTAPFEIFLIGGDDATLALPAQYAAGFAEKFFGHFDRLFPESVSAPWREKYAQTPPKVSLAIVFSHSRFPVYMAIDRATELLRGAKTRAYQLGGSHMVDYLVVTNAMEREIADLRQEQYRDASGNSRVWRPFALDEFRRARDLSESMKLLPRTKVAALFDLMFGGTYQSTLDYCYWLVGLEERSRNDFRVQMKDDWDIMAAPFDKHGRSPLVDSIELADFLR